jgi:hypothetical protein
MSLFFELIFFAIIFSFPSAAVTKLKPNEITGAISLR